jgi:hypothetical protein
MVRRSNAVRERTERDERLVADVRRQLDRLGVPAAVSAEWGDLFLDLPTSGWQVDVMVAVENSEWPCWLGGRQVPVTLAEAGLPGDGMAHSVGVPRREAARFLRALKSLPAGTFADDAGLRRG